MSESAKHHWHKREVARCLSELGVITLGNEIDGSDVLAVGPDYLAALEVEEAVKNVSRNFFRNLSKGIWCTIIVAPNFAVLRDIANKLDRNFSPEYSQRVGLTTIDTLRLLAGLTNNHNK